MTPSWQVPSSTTWSAPNSPTYASAHYHTSMNGLHNVPQMAGKESSAGLTTASAPGRTKPSRSSTGPSSTTSPYRGFNATIGAHLQEQQQTKTISLFDNPSPLASPFTPQATPQTDEPLTVSSPPSSTTTAAPQEPTSTPSYPVLSANTAPFVPSLRTSTASSVNLGIGSQYGSIGSVGIGGTGIGGTGISGVGISGMGGSPRHSSSPANSDAASQFSSAVGGFTEKRPLSSSAKSPRSTTSNGIQVSPRKISSSDSSNVLPDFETISQIWGDDHALFDVAWPWSPSCVQSNTEVTVRSADRGQKTFSASF